MSKWPLIVSLLIPGVLFAQGQPTVPAAPSSSGPEWKKQIIPQDPPPPSDQSGPTFGWTKASLYLARASKRPFRIFLDPERTDTAPEGIYLHQWKVVYPAPANYKSGQVRFLVQDDEVMIDGDLIVFYLLREDQNKKAGYLGWLPYDQWVCLYNQKEKTLKAIRWGIFDVGGEPIKFEDYAASGGIPLGDDGPAWTGIKKWIAAAPEREKAKMDWWINANKQGK